MSDFSGLIKPYRITHGKKFRLTDIDPAATGDFDSKERAEELLQRGVKELDLKQEKLFAMDQWSLLLIFQAMDAAGKDGTIKHVMSGLNPQGCDVSAFKAPSSEELDHDFLWRCARRLPLRGRIGIFNRSYYEDVLVVRVHRRLLEAQKIPPQLMTKHIWKNRFQDIRGFERHLMREGVVIRKFYLHISKEEQRKRFLSRLEEKGKNWKFSSADLAEREYWDDYMRAYEDMIRHTATPECPWYVIPADHKWFSRLAVAAVVNDALESLPLHIPKVTSSQEAELAKARKILLGEK